MGVDRNFTITQAQADKYNKTQLMIPVLVFGYWDWVLRHAHLGTSILLIIYLIRRKRHKDEEEERKAVSKSGSHEEDH